MLLRTRQKRVALGLRVVCISLVTVTYILIGVASQGKGVNNPQDNLGENFLHRFNLDVYLFIFLKLLECVFVFHIKMSSGAISGVLTTTT